MNALDLDKWSEDDELLECPACGEQKLIPVPQESMPPVLCLNCSANFVPDFFQRVLGMELGGFEPPTSGVRFRPDVVTPHNKAICYAG